MKQLRVTKVTICEYVDALCTVHSFSHPGSNVIVAGTAIFGAADPNGVIATLKATVNAAQEKIAQARA